MEGCTSYHTMSGGGIDISGLLLNNMVYFDMDDIQQIKGTWYF
jgi:hypothetical protein